MSCPELEKVSFLDLTKESYSSSKINKFYLLQPSSVQWPRWKLQSKVLLFPLALVTLAHNGCRRERSITGLLNQGKALAFYCAPKEWRSRGRVKMHPTKKEETSLGEKKAFSYIHSRTWDFGARQTDQTSSNGMGFPWKYSILWSINN